MINTKFGIVTKNFENKTKEKGLLEVKLNDIVEIISNDIDGTWCNVKIKDKVGQIQKDHFKAIETKELYQVTSPAIEEVLKKILSKEDTTRAVSISIENNTNFQLYNGSWICISGTEGNIKPQSKIEKNEIGFCCFKKSDYSVNYFYLLIFKFNTE